MELSDILVVEDDEKNIKDAKEVLGEIQIARSFAEFEDKFTKEKPKYVLSDLYFPTGYIGERHEKLKSEAASILDSYIKEQQKHNAVGRALETIFAAKEIKTLDQFFEIFKDDSVIQMEKWRNILRERYNDYEKVRNYKQLLKDINDNVHDLPSGIFVYKHCKNENFPCMIVTSAYHHGTEFQPFVKNVGSFFDNLVNGKKQWKEALEYISGEK